MRLKPFIFSTAFGPVAFGITSLLTSGCITDRYYMSGMMMTPPLVDGADDGKEYYDTSDLPSKGKPESGRVIGYFTNWSTGRTGDCAYDVNLLDATLLTHINYAFGKVESGPKENPAFKLVAATPRDVGQDGQFRQITSLKKKHPHLKVLLSVGGWAANDPPNAWVFTTMSATSKYRHQFISSAVKLLREYDFDGLDIDWEYPGSGERGGYPADRQNYIKLLSEFQAAARDEAKQSGKPELLLTAATPSSSYFLGGYDLSEIHKRLDWINVMTYDYYGPWNSQTGANSPLLADSTPGGNTFVKTSIQRYLDSGVPSDKLVLGMPTYGKSFAGLKTPTISGLSSGHGPAGRCTGEKGTVAYFEIQELLKGGGYQRFWDARSGTPFAYSESEKALIAYDDQESLALKVAYIKEQKLGGAMFWALDLDEFRNQYPLISSVSAAIRQR